MENSTMPKLLNSVPKYRIHKASGQAIVTLSGKDFYLGPHGSQASRTAYDRLTSEWLANGRNLRNTDRATYSVEELLAAFWEHAAKYYIGLDGKATKELDSYRQAMKPLRALYATTSVEDFGPLALKAIRQVLITKGLARKTVNQQIGRVKRIFKWGVKSELVPPGVFQALQAVSGLKKGRTEAKETPPVSSVSESIVNALKPHVSRQVWAMIQLQLLTGMRSGEVTAMRGCDITIKNEVWEYSPPFHKTAYRSQARVICLGPKAQAILKGFLREELNAYLFSPQKAQEERNAERKAERVTPITPSQASRQRKVNPLKSPGERYTTESYGRSIKYAIKKAKSESWSPHQLRHTAATRIREEFGLEAAQVILGHSRADVTQVYAETNKRKAAEIMGNVG